MNTFIKNSHNTKINLIIKKTKHLDYSDIPLFSPIIKYVMDVGNLPSNQSTNLLNNLVYQFLEKYLINSLKNNFDEAITNRLIEVNI